MDKNAIKKYAVWARRELISRVTQRALKYGISEKEIIPTKETSIHGVALSPTEIAQRTALISRISNKGFEQVMEEVAYTWFNRFSALRFMEVNGYLPTHVRVFTDDENNFKPQIMAEAINLEMDGLDMEKVYCLKDANDNDALFKYLIITQCNALSSILPGMFQKIDDFTELLFPDNLLREGSVIEQMIVCIPEDDWKDQVQIIGWLYQYYNTEPKDKVFADLKKNIKISKENIPAATQLFTPDWIVRYMVENSLGRLWLEGHPNTADQLLPTKEEQEKYIAGDRNEDDHKWHYYLEEAEQEVDVQAKLSEIRKKYASLKPEDIKCIDPCSGSGHILAYMFDVLVRIYEAYGYTAREAAASIVENNLYGLDIDDRAAQLAYFSVMMKARQYDRRFFSHSIQPHVFSIRESNGLDKYAVEYFCDGRAGLIKDMNTLMDEMRDAKEYGSILNVSQVDFVSIYARFNEISDDISIYRDNFINELLPFVRVSETLGQKYHIVVTNPPYMGSKGMKNSLLEYIQSNYSEGKADLYAAFIQKILKSIITNGYIGLLTPYVWLYLSSFERLRQQIINGSDICSLVQLEYNAFEVACVPVCTFILRKRIGNYRGRYIQLASFKGWENQEWRTLDAIDDFSLNYCYEADQEKYKLVAGTPIAYWLSESMYRAINKGKPLSQYGSPKQGMATADNGRFMRRWYEVSLENTDFNCTDVMNTKKKWYPHSKGGNIRRWYGNNEYVINWQNNGREIREFKKAVVRNSDSYFKAGITWSDLTISWFTARKIPSGFTFDSAGPTYFAYDEKMLNYYCGYFNSWVFQEFLNISCQGMHYSNGVIAQLPIIIGSDEQVAEITEIVNENVAIAKADWDDLETSWDFMAHPFVLYKGSHNYLKNILDIYLAICEERVRTLTNNERRNDEIFAAIFNMTDIIPTKGICPQTLNKITNKELVVSFLSYVVGCIFGRYSISEKGIVYAGGEWNGENYKSFPADKDNIIPISDDEYFEDDITNRFVDFIRTVYGESTLNENLKFIADALGGKGHPKEVIRNYFLNDFYADHLKIYQKRPIYWLFDSGKKNGFKCLIYMHRYQPDTIARIRTDYVHEQQSRYRTSIADLEKRVASASTSEKVKLTKQLSKLQDQAAELHEYEEKIHHLADQYISIDLDDGVKVNYAKFQDVLAKIK